MVAACTTELVAGPSDKVVKFIVFANLFFWGGEENNYYTQFEPGACPRPSRPGGVDGCPQREHHAVPHQERGLAGRLVKKVLYFMGLVTFFRETYLRAKYSGVAPSIVEVGAEVFRGVLARGRLVSLRENTSIFNRVSKLHFTVLYPSVKIQEAATLGIKGDLL